MIGVTSLGYLVHVTSNRTKKMIVAGKSIVAFFMLIAPFMVYGQTCASPQVDSNIYTTTEASSSTDTVFIIQFGVTCKNGAKNMNLYADLNGKTVAVTKSEENSKYPYQVSFSDEHKHLASGSYEVKFYDEDGFSSLRKAQRSGDSTESVSSVFSINVSHPGVWKGPLLQSEFIAASVAILVWYFAYTAKNKLQAS